MTTETPIGIAMDCCAWMNEKLGRKYVADAAAPPELRFSELSPLETKSLVDELKRDIDTNRFRVSGVDENNIWERGWQEVANRVSSSGVNEENLHPQYFGKYPFVRLDGRFIRPITSNFEAIFDRWIREQIFRAFLAGSDRIVELGCGTGNSLFLLQQMFPGKEFVGADWAKSSQKIISEIARVTNSKLVGQNLNMFTMEGWEALRLDSSTAILSVHALEQLGDKFHSVTDALINAKPQLCVHIEPLIEHYDETNEFDQLAVAYHRKRNYLNGWLNYMQHKGESGVINVLMNTRLGFGGVYHEAYSVFVWQPAQGVENE